MPLVTKRLARNVAALCNSVANVLVDSGYVARKLQRNARDKLVCMADVSAATREEEAGSESLPLKVSAGDRAGNGGLPCAGPAV